MLYPLSLWGYALPKVLGMVQFVVADETRVPADVKTLMQVFSLPPMEAKLLQAMLTNEWVGKDELPEIKYSLRQVVLKLRRTMSERQVWILNDGGGRYALSLHGKETVRRIISNAMAVTP